MIRFIRSWFRKARHAQSDRKYSADAADVFDSVYRDAMRWEYPADRLIPAPVSDDTAELRPIPSFPVARVVASRQYYADRVRRIYDDIEAEILMSLSRVRGWSVPEWDRWQ